jgi:release factor glutamine methyltransferase
VTVREALRDAGRSLADAGCPSPRSDAELLLADALGVSRTELYADPGRELSPEAEARFSEHVARRAAREPTAYILGEWGFRRLRLKVDARVLVPRPETEVVVERALEHIRTLAEPRVLDVGTGSGAIALAIADEHPGSRVVGTDVSADALAVASENRMRTRLEERVELVHGHLAAGLRGPFDLVVSNPPYVTPDEFPSLDPDIRLYEPRGAVVGAGETEGVARDAREILRPGGWLVLECSDTKAARVCAALRALGYEDVASYQDLAGRDRVVEGRQPLGPDRGGRC